jgi:hypothetical protein
MRVAHLIARLADLTRGLGAERCPACRRPMQLQSEEPLDPRHAAFELLFVCVPCGERTRRVRVYDFQ